MTPFYDQSNGDDADYYAIDNYWYQYDEPTTGYKTVAADTNGYVPWKFFTWAGCWNDGINAYNTVEYPTGIKPGVSISPLGIKWGYVGYLVKP